MISLAAAHSRAMARTNGFWTAAVFVAFTQKALFLNSSVQNSCTGTCHRFRDCCCFTVLLRDGGIRHSHVTCALNLQPWRSGLHPRDNNEGVCGCVCNTDIGGLRCEDNIAVQPVTCIVDLLADVVLHEDCDTGKKIKSNTRCHNAKLTVKCPDFNMT